MVVSLGFINDIFLCTVNFPYLEVKVHPKLLISQSKFSGSRNLLRDIASFRYGVEI